MKTLLPLTVLLLLAGCASHPPAPPKDAELSRDSSAARAAFNTGTMKQAADLYAKALNRAVAMDDAGEITTAAYNLALCQTVLGQLDQATATLNDAKPALRRSGANPTDVLLLEATIAQRQNKWDQALVLAQQAQAASQNEDQRFQVALLQAGAALHQGDLGRANAALTEAAKHHVTNATLLATRERLNGEVLVRQGNPAEGAKALDRAADLFRQAKHYHDMARALQSAGQAYHTAGDSQNAEDRLTRAKRSLAAQGEKAP